MFIKECGLVKDSVIADIGSGTGLLSRLFLDYGNRVYGVEPTKQEFYRIAKPHAWIAILWNVRDTENSALARDCIDYCSSMASKWDQLELEKFFKPNTMQTACFSNKQVFNWEGFKARLLSSSYSLRPDDANYSAMLDKLKQIFAHYQQNGRVDFLYKTKLYFAKLEK